MYKYQLSVLNSVVSATCSQTDILHDLKLNFLTPTSKIRLMVDQNIPSLAFTAKASIHNIILNIFSSVYKYESIFNIIDGLKLPLPFYKKEIGPPSFQTSNSMSIINQYLQYMIILSKELMCWWSYTSYKSLFCVLVRVILRNSLVIDN